MAASPRLRVAMLPVVVLTARVAAAQTTPPAPSQPLPHETLFYQNDGLRLEAYLYLPAGEGPFPLVVYNHGSAPAGQEGREFAASFIAQLLLPAGYAVLVPERRGYGKSEGLPFSQDVGADRGQRFVQRQRQEASDVNAAADYVLARPGAPLDRHRVAIIGYSFGGIVTTLAASESHRYAAVVLQAPGALNWEHSEMLRRALVAAAAKIPAPTWCGCAENDATTGNVSQLCGAVARAGTKAVHKIYPPFTGAAPGAANPGHAVFGARGVDVWREDVMTFLAEALHRSAGRP
jgi:dienelactone hydrolase